MDMKDKCHRLNSVSVKLMAHARGFCCISLHATVLLTREKPMMGKKNCISYFVSVHSSSFQSESIQYVRLNSIMVWYAHSV